MSLALATCQEQWSEKGGDLPSITWAKEVTRCAFPEPHDEDWAWQSSSVATAKWSLLRCDEDKRSALLGAMYFHFLSCFPSYCKVVVWVDGLRR